MNKDISIPKSLDSTFQTPSTEAMNTLSDSNYRMSDPEKGIPTGKELHCNLEEDGSRSSTSNTIDASRKLPSLKGPEDDSPDISNVSRLTRLRSSSGFLSFTIALGFFVDLLCYGIIMPLTPFIIQDLGLDSTANGVLIACYAAGLLISSPIVGIISDRIVNRRLPMIAGLVALFLSMVLFMEALNHYWLLLIARFFAGLAGGTVMTLGFALLSDTYPANRLGIEMGKVMIGHTLGLMVGPPLGGILQENVGKKAPYVFCLILIAIDLIARIMIIESRNTRKNELKKHEKQKQKEAMNSAGIESDNENKGYFTTLLGLMKNKRLITALYVSLLDAFLVSSIEPVLPIYLEKRFHLSESQIGLVFLAISVPTVLSPLAGWLSDKHGGKMISLVSIFLCAVFTVLLGLPSNPLWAIIILLFLIGATCAAFITPVLGEISAVVRTTGDGDGFARAFAMFNMCFSVGMVTGPILGSLVYQASELIWMCVMVAAIAVLGLPLVLLFMGDRAQKLKDQEQYELDMEKEEQRMLQMEKDRQDQMMERNSEVVLAK